MQKSDEASPSTILASRSLLVKMLITLEPQCIFGSNFVYLCILTLPSHCNEKCDEASPSIILAGRVFLMKMLITQEMINLLFMHDFWHRIPINLRSPRAVHITVS